MKFFGTRFGTFTAIALVVVVMGGAIAVAGPGRTRLSSASKVTLCSDDLRAWLKFTEGFHLFHIEPTWPPVFGPSTGVSKWIERRLSLQTPVTRKQRRAYHSVPNVRSECTSLMSRRVDVTQFPSPYVVSRPKSGNTSVSGSRRSTLPSRQSIRGSAVPERR